MPLSGVVDGVAVSSLPQQANTWICVMSRLEFPYGHDDSHNVYSDKSERHAILNSKYEGQIAVAYVNTYGLSTYHNQYEYDCGLLSPPMSQLGFRDCDVRPWGAAYQE